MGNLCSAFGIDIIYGDLNELDEKKNNQKENLYKQSFHHQKINQRNIVPTHEPSIGNFINIIYFIKIFICIGCAAGTLQTKLNPFMKIPLQSGGYRHQKQRLQATNEF